MNTIQKACSSALMVFTVITSPLSTGRAEAIAFEENQPVYSGNTEQIDSTANSYIANDSSSAIVAIPNPAKVLVDGLEISFDAYNINGNNYFKLRDLAFALTNSSARFDVIWDAEKNAINLITGKSYTMIVR